MSDNEEPRQLKLGGKSESKEIREKGKKNKEKEPKANKWVLIAILLATVGACLFFYMSNRIGGTENTGTGNLGGWLKPKVIEF